MILDKASTNRLCIYFLYDKDGIIDDYIPFMLKNLKPFCKEICFVSNGKITQGKEKIAPYVNVILERENRGFDVGAYKEAIYHYGWKKLSAFDEVIFMNYTLFGPVYPFEDMFVQMSEKDLDFWGITKHHGVSFDPFHLCKYNYLPEHIQSSFIAIRKNMLSSKIYQNFIDSLAEIKSYGESVCYYEVIFTKDFTDAGFKSALYMDTCNLEGYTWYPLLKMSKLMLEERKCPVFKVKSFSEPYLSVMLDGYGNCTTELFDYLRKQNLYNLDWVLKHVIRTANMSDLQKMMHLNALLPTDYIISAQSENQPQTALILHLHYSAQTEVCLEFAANMPKNSDLIVTTNNPEIRDIVEQHKIKRHFKNVIVLEVPNIGKDLAPLFIAARPYIKDYDYICFAHDEDLKKHHFYCEALKHWQKNIYNILGSKEYVANILQTFVDNKFLGVLIPPQSWHGNYYKNVGSEWDGLFEQVSSLCSRLKINAVLEKDKEPVAPLGTMFWFRPQALAPLFDHKWEYNDFAISENEETYRCLKRIIPFTAQSCGYYTSYLSTLSQAAIEIDSMYYMLRELNKNLFKIFGKMRHIDLYGCIIGAPNLDIYAIRDAYLYKKLLFKYYKSKILAHVLWGKVKSKHLEKAEKIKQRIKNVKKYLRQFNLS